MASALPPGGKKPSASQQEISNHFSDTKATGMRCRSADEDLWRAEVCVSCVSCVSWHIHGQQTGQTAGGVCSLEMGLYQPPDSRDHHGLAGSPADRVMDEGLGDSGVEAGWLAIPPSCAISRCWLWDEPRARVFASIGQTRCIALHRIERTRPSSYNVPLTFCHWNQVTVMVSFNYQFDTT